MTSPSDEHAMPAAISAHTARSAVTRWARTAINSAATVFKAVYSTMPKVPLRVELRSTTLIAA
ncbi:Uncharacterised protein [Mycobacterium tuberculosis]|nr:Uncharacterised protein [Mycobacterium tuberculosis]